MNTRERREPTMRKQNVKCGCKGEARQKEEQLGGWHEWGIGERGVGGLNWARILTFLGQGDCRKKSVRVETAAAFKKEE